MPRCYVLLEGRRRRRREEARGGVGGELVFLGHEFSACFRAEQFPTALKPGCAYLVDDCRLDEKELPARHCQVGHDER
uniref:Uncharacterized protein n=1 Tax=Oryza barthii TaxID=65489 RepID=A0A0D3HNL9_9ORYZ